MAANLWKHFSTDLRCDDADLCDVLVHPKSNILPNIKHFSLEMSAENFNFTEIQRMRFTLFMMALPKNKLAEFVSEVRFDSTMFRVLIQFQQQLRSIAITFGESFSKPPVLSSYLIAVEDISIRLYGEDEQSAMIFKRYEPLLLQTPNLRSLQIRPSIPEKKRFPNVGSIEFPVVGDGSDRLRLKYLDLSSLILGDHHVRISNHISFETLVSLKLDRCALIPPFLDELIRTFTKGHSFLENLHVCYNSDYSWEGDHSAIMHIIERLLLSFQGLVTLYVSVSQCEPA